MPRARFVKRGAKCPFKNAKVKFVGRGKKRRKLCIPR